MKYRKNVYQSFTMITQFGINMIVPILMCTMFGVYIGKKYDMLFIIGALAGFRNCYKMAKKYSNRKAAGIQRMLRRLNKALPELVLGILLYGMIVWIAGIWFVEDKLLYSTGIWLGMGIAVMMAVHMAVVIENAVSLSSGQGKLIAMSLFRYMAVAAAFFCIAYFNIGNPIAAFIGVMGLKIAAYMQPLIHKIILRLQGREEFSKKCEIETVEDKD